MPLEPLEAHISKIRFFNAFLISIDSECFDVLRRLGDDLIIVPIDSKRILVSLATFAPLALRARLRSSHGERFLLTGSRNFSLRIFRHREAFSLSPPEDPIVQMLVTRVARSNLNHPPTPSFQGGGKTIILAY